MATSKIPRHFRVTDKDTQRQYMVKAFTRQAAKSFLADRNYDLKLPTQQELLDYGKAQGEVLDATVAPAAATADPAASE